MANKNINGDVNVSFTEAQSRQSLESGESVKTLFGKLRKWLSDLKPVAFSGSYNDLTDKPTLGTASAKDVPSSGNASTTQVVMGSDTRLSDSRPASDVSSWAKASTKPTYTASEVGAAPTSHTQASSTITAMTGYSKPQSTSAIAATDTLNEAIGKLEKGLDGAGTPNDGVLTIQQNGTPIGTFSANQAGNTTVNIEAAPAPYIISRVTNTDDGTNIVLNDLDVSVLDSINYYNLFTGESYSIKTRVYDSSSGTYINIIKNGINSTEISSNFVPTMSNGSYNIGFVLDDLSDIPDNTILQVIEKLYYNNEVISTYTSNLIVDSEISSWELLQKKVRNNRMNKINIGDQFECMFGQDVITLDVIGKNQDIPSESSLSNSLTLRVHNPLFNIDGLESSQEAFYYCGTELKKGRYYTKTYSSYSSYVNQSFYLTKDVPAGGQLTREKVGSTWYIRSYANSKTTSYIEQTTWTNNSTSGTFLGDLYYSSASGNMNSYLGANNKRFAEYKNSDIHQWLNSNKIAGEWWEPQNKWSRPPTFINRNGFLYDLDSEVRNVIGQVQKETALKSHSSSSDIIDTTNEMAFLLSLTETYGGFLAPEGYEYHVCEGSPYMYYSDNSSLSEPGKGADNCRIIYTENNNSTSYWLRTLDVKNSTGHLYIYTDGRILSGSSVNAAVVPVFNII